MAQMATELTVVFLLVSAAIIVFMQAGFAMLEVGAVRAKNAKSILYKNMLDFAVGVCVWWLWGFAVAADGASGQLHGENYAHVSGQNDVFFLHSFSFAIAAATIVSGSVAERMAFSAYIVHTIVMVGFIYPLAARWVWGSDGFLRRFGALDFAGSGVVHVLGGLSGLGASIVVGPRLHRFRVDNENKVVVTDLHGHSPILSNLGVYILLFGWLMFNASSSLSADTQDDALRAGRAATNTALASGAACVCAVVAAEVKKDRVHDIATAHNTLLGGAVAITAGSGYVDSWAAIVVGLVAGMIVVGLPQVVMGLFIDDPLDAFTVHGAAGVWGVIALGLFASPSLVPEGADCGLFMGGSGQLLKAQLVTCLVLCMWAGGTTVVIFLGLKWIPSLGVRVSKEVEVLGMDYKYHEGFAWPEFTTHDDFVQRQEAVARERARQKHKRRRKQRVSYLARSFARHSPRVIRARSMTQSTSDSDEHEHERDHELTGRGAGAEVRENRALEMPEESALPTDGGDFSNDDAV